LNNLRAENIPKRNRLIALCFAGLLLIIMYGLLAQWFVAADRMLFDQLATRLPSKPLANASIISIDPARLTSREVQDLYGSIVSVLKRSEVARIILAQPPELTADAVVPSWATSGGAGVPVYAPTHTRFGNLATRSGFVDINPDRDGVLRRAALWQLNNGVLSPSLPLAISFDMSAGEISPRLSGVEDAIYASNYAELPRLDVKDVLDSSFERSMLRGATVFLDASPPLVGAAAVLPSGQFVTVSEYTAALLADLENDRTVFAPTWIIALELLAPIALATIAVLFLLDRSRKDIAVLAGVSIIILILIQTLMLYVLHLRIDLGRPLLLFVGTTLLCAWLVGNKQKEVKDSFKRGSAFLAAGRLEPAFAEFRRCPPSESLATIMYKLSIAFEQQAKPERAEAVLQWMKRTHHGSNSSRTSDNQLTKGLPQRMGRYVIVKRIGRGAMGAVYLATDPRINRQVALKAIPIEKEFEDEELREARLRFYREAESAGRLAHPNIITVFDAGEDKGMAYIAMEYVPGIPLKQFTDRNRLLAPKRALELCATTAEALDYAHSQGVIHRDIKPANLIYNPKEGALKITDFGVARMTDNNSTKTGIVLGTPMYMSPEQLGAEVLTGSSDLFSLGVTLYELLTGEVPFKAENIAVLMTKITSEIAAPIARMRPGLTPSIDAVLARAMAKDPNNRFSSGVEMAIALRNSAKTI
jgi:tRNA A-37 threonylcarbamoyl transferase component Bud32/CHASE2 domain-containing sensor protein